MGKRDTRNLISPLPLFKISGEIQQDWCGILDWLVEQISNLFSTWSSLCCLFKSSCSNGDFNFFASSSSSFCFISWFRRRCSRTRCSSGLLSSPTPLWMGGKGVGQYYGKENNPNCYYSLLLIFVSRPSSGQLIRYSFLLSSQQLRELGWTEKSDWLKITQ